MIHEAMVLDHSGPLFGIISYASALKLFILGTVLLHVIFPFRISISWVNWLLYILEMLVLAVSIGVVESVMARLQMKHVPYLLISAILFCAFGFVLLFR